MYKVKKRSGKTVVFEMDKICDVIRRAFEAEEVNYNDDIVDFLALKVTADFEPKVKNNVVSVEDIQDSVEAVLSKSGYTEVAKAYILYRKMHEKIRNIKTTLLDYKEIVSYISSNSNYYIQNFKNSNDVFNRNLSSFSEKELVEMKNKINNKNIYFRDL